jgi:RES domain-containing protein
MIVYRLCLATYKNDLSGKGAELSGGRWNNKGRPMLYTSSSRALCTAEVAVHLPLGIVPGNYYMVSILLPEKAAMHEVLLEDLPTFWKNFSALSFSRKLGDDFLQTHETLILKVPSAVVQGDHNYLVNPTHSDAKKIKVLSSELFEFDERLFNRD